MKFMFFNKISLWRYEVYGGFFHENIAKAILYMHLKITLNFVYSVDKTVPVIKLIDFNRAESTCYRTNFPYACFGYQNGASSYIVLRIMHLIYT